MNDEYRSDRFIIHHSALITQIMSEAIYQAGLRALEQADFETAVERFAEVVVEYPEHSHAWLHLGVCYLELRELESAIEALNRAIIADPFYADAYYWLGLATGSAGDIDRAAECYRKALELDPEHPKAMEFLTRTETLLESRAHYRQAVQWLHPSDESERNVNAAIRELLYSVSLFTNSPARHDLLRCAQQIAEHQVYAPRSIEVDPENRFWVEACRIGLRCLEQRYWDAATKAYIESLEYQENEAFVHHAIGLVRFQAGDVEEGVQAWLRVLELEPDFDFTKIVRLEPR
jgi:tetratricopeptide (TPR) repeat protein